MAGMIDLVGRGEIARGLDRALRAPRRPAGAERLRGGGDVSIETERPSAVELAVLDGVQKRVLWLAAAIVHHANRVRPNRSGVKVGGHQASSASMVSLMTALWFAFLEAPDRVSVKPHASPVLHAINYLLGRLDRRYLTTLRAVRRPAVLPARTKDPDPVDYSTGSVGIGATAPIWGALAHRYVAGHFDVAGRRAPDRADRRRRARRGRLLGGDRRPDGRAARRGACGSSTSTASRSTASCPTSPPGRLALDVRGRRLAHRDGQVRAAARRARPALRARDRRDAQRGVPAAAARRRAASCGERLEVDADDLDDDELLATFRDLGGHDLARAARRLPPGRRGPRPPDRRLRLHDQGLVAADRGPPRQPLGAAQRTSSTRELAAELGADPDDPWARFDARLAGGRAVRGDGASACGAAPRAPCRAADGARRPRPRAHGHRLDPAGVRALLRRPRARGAGGGRARGHRLARRRHLDQPRRLDQQGRHLVASATASTGSPTTPTRSCAGARPTTAATSSSGSPRSTSSGCSASSARRGRATASRCCRSARSTTRSWRARSSRGRSASTPAASRSSSARRAASRSGPRAARTSR